MDISLARLSPFRACRLPVSGSRKTAETPSPSSRAHDTVTLHHVSPPRPDKHLTQTSAAITLAAATTALNGPLGPAVMTESERVNALFRDSQTSTDGLRAPDVARRLVTAREKGATFMCGGRDPEAIGPAEAYHTLLSENPHLGTLYLGLEGIPMVACRRDTLDAGIQTFAPLAEAHREVLQRGRFDAYGMQCAVDRLASPHAAADPHAHAALLVELYEAVQASGAHDRSTAETGHAMTRVYDWLAPRLDQMTPAQLSDVKAWTARGGADEACKAAGQATALEGAAYTEFASVMRLVGHVETAVNALARVDGAPTDERAAHLDALMGVCALYATSLRGTEALDAFTAVLEARAPNEPVRAAADRYAVLHRALAARGLEAQAVHSFSTLERHWRGSGDDSPQPTYLTFLDHLQRIGRADLSALEAAAPGVARGVERGDGAVVIGGVRLPIRGA